MRVRRTVIATLVVLATPFVGGSVAHAVDAEDGTKVRAGFYSRTDYNRNGITDQKEPGWGKPGWEEKFKAVGTAKYRAMIRAMGLNPDCFQIGDDCKKS
ncbi:hypothetical protein ACFY7C_19525 [Streptomyces sp. NPDC012769]|uniref:hypothetical protein n=1 Tax=Streptomyces sp. NPDC012769 TaxID=3364848 RepID=UPI0036BE7BC8